MDLSKLCVISSGEFEGLTVYKELPTEGNWDAYAFADAGCAAGDILRCAENTLQTGHVTVGYRESTGFWNKLTCLCYKVFAGLKLRDGDPSIMVLPQRPVHHFYKATRLLDMKKADIPFEEKPVTQAKEAGFIKSVGTWFLILRHFIKYGLSAVASALIEEGMLALFGRLFLGLFKGFSFTFVTAGLAWVVSSVCNFFMNQKLVFESKGKTLPALLRYYMVAIPNMLLQLALTHGLYQLFNIPNSASFLRTAIYVAVMCVLFLVSFKLQQRWVFASKTSNKEDKVYDKQ